MTPDPLQEQNLLLIAERFLQLPAYPPLLLQVGGRTLFISGCCFDKHLGLVVLCYTVARPRLENS